MSNHNVFMSSMNILLNEEYDTLSTLCRKPKLQINPHWEKYIAGSSTCSTKQLSINMINILSEVKEGLPSFCGNIYSSSRFNQWMLPNNFISGWYSRKCHLFKIFTSTLWKPFLVKIHKPVQRYHLQRTYP